MRDTTSSCARSEALETLSGAQLTAWQTGRLREVANHAYREVPFYRELWDRAGVEPGLLRSLEDFARFPTISKHDLVQAGDGWTNPHQGSVAFSTRGTSGAPLLVWLSRGGRGSIHSADDARLSLGWLPVRDDRPVDEPGMAPSRRLRGARDRTLGRPLRVFLGKHGYRVHRLLPSYAGLGSGRNSSPPPRRSCSP